MTRHMRVFVLAVVLAAASAAAFAQQPIADQVTQGPMQLQQSHDGFLIAPEVKATHFDKGGGTGWLVGGYGGWIIDNRLLIGAGGDVMTNHTSNVHDMGYFGAVVEWLGGTNQAIGWSARSLVGFGTATIEDTFPINYYYSPDPRMMGPNNVSGPYDPRNPGNPLRPIGGPSYVRAAFHEDFFVFEPQANVLFNLSHSARFTAGVGYRVIGGANGYDNRLRGVTGTVAFELGPH